MKNSMIAIGLAALVALQPAGATTVELTTEYSEQADFSRLKTFAWLETNISFAEANDAGASEGVDALIRSRVADTLAEKGYEQLPDRGQPDFLVSYHVVVTREDNAKMMGLQPASDTGDALRKGTLIIYAVDAASKRLLWQSVAAATAATTCEALRETGSVVNSMLQAFPPNGSS